VSRLIVMQRAASLYDLVAIYARGRIARGRKARWKWLHRVFGPALHGPVRPRRPAAPPRRLMLPLAWA